MAYSIGHPVYIKGTYWYQKGRETIIQRLAERIETALQFFVNTPENNRKWPLHLIVYRAGISEGENTKVCNF